MTDRNRCQLPKIKFQTHLTPLSALSHRQSVNEQTHPSIHPQTSYSQMTLSNPDAKKKNRKTQKRNDKTSRRDPNQTSKTPNPAMPIEPLDPTEPNVTPRWQPTAVFPNRLNPLPRKLNGRFIVNPVRRVPRPPDDRSGIRMGMEVGMERGGEVPLVLVSPPRRKRRRRRI